MPAAGLFEGGFKISAGGQRYDLEAIGIGFGHAQRAAADRAGGAEDGDAFHWKRKELSIEPGPITHFTMCVARGVESLELCE